MLSKCCWWWCGCCRVRSRLHNCLNLQLSYHKLHNSLKEVVSSVPLSRLHQFVKPHLLLPKALHAVLYRSWDCDQLPARFIIFTQLAKLWIFLIIILDFSILLILGTCKIAQTVSDRSQHLVGWNFRLSSWRSCLFNIPHMFLLLHNRSLWVLNSLSCHCSISIHIIFDPFLSFFIGKKFVCLHFSSESFFLECKQPNAPTPRTLSVCKPLWPLFAWWCRHVECCIYRTQPEMSLVWAELRCPVWPEWRCYVWPERRCLVWPKPVISCMAGDDCWLGYGLIAVSRTSLSYIMALCPS